LSDDRTTPSRRELVAGSALLVGAAAVPTWRALTPPPLDELAAWLVRQVPEVPVDEDEARRFLDAHLASYLSPDRFHLGHAIGPVDLWAGKQMTLVQRFLMSTNWFPDEDPDQPVRFVALHEPYAVPCHNPRVDASPPRPGEDG